MPVRSKAQLRFLFAAERRGQLPVGTASNWIAHTPSMKDIPEKLPSRRQRKQPQDDDMTLAKQAVLSYRTRVGNTTPLLNPLPALPSASTATAPKQQLTQTAAALGQPNMPAGQTQPPQPPQAPTGSWQPGATGAAVYPPGQGPVSGQVQKVATGLALGQKLARNYLALNGR